MSRSRLLRGFSLLLIFLVATLAFATTWNSQDFVCPLCSTKNTFQVIMSYGNYIYSWPEKYQLIYWPVTVRESLYHCKKCHYTAFLWDFEKPPKEKIDSLRAMLAAEKLDAPAGEYTKIPMSVRLGIAERVYALLDKDDDFWCRFYRIKAYHFDAEHKPGEADAARRKALEIASKLLNDENHVGARKELLVISGAMRHFLGEDKAALDDLRAAAALKFHKPELKDEQNQNYDGYLSGLLKDYIAAIEKGEGPARAKS